MSVTLFKQKSLYQKIQNLFANGEPGFWLDPSDFTTMFTDAAGTTPVTAVEQPVGLILDKSKGLVLGADIVTNGQFATDTGWTKSPGVTISGGKLNFTAVLGSQGATQGAGTIPAGGVYLATITIDSISAGGIRYQIGSYFAAGMNYTTPGTYVARVWAGATAGDIEILAVGTTTAVISSFSLKQIAGTHYYQSTAGVRPVLSARVNGLIKTEDFSNAAWVKSGTGTPVSVTVNAGVAPDGTNTAALIYPSASAPAGTYLIQSVSVIAGATRQICIAKAAGISCIWMYANTGAAYGIYYLNLITGVSQVVAGSTATGAITSSPLGNGWYSFAYTNNLPSGTYNVGIGVCDANGSVSVTKSGTNGILIWNPDVRPSDQATGLIPTYQRVNTSTDYDTASFPLYLSGNGTQWMQCAAQDYTGVNKMLVCAGVRKTNGTGAVIFELSSNSTSAGSPGSFSLQQVLAISHDTAFYARGASSALYSYILNTEPVTDVVSAAIDVSGSAISSKLNGAAGGWTNTGSTGGGNFGNYAAYLFCRAGTSLFFTGQMFQIICRGSTVASNAAQIAATENWTDSKCRAY